MTSFKIAVLAGDGIGPEVCAAALQVLRATARSPQSLEIEYAPIGGAAIEAWAQPLPEVSLKLCLASDAVLLGAVGGPQWDHLAQELRPEQGLLRLRQELGVYTNLRPIRTLPALSQQTPYRASILEGVDMLIVRELSSGLYFGQKIEHEDFAEDRCRYTRAEIERVCHHAAQWARNRRKKLTLVDKANVLASSRLWRRTVRELIARDYPDITLEMVYVDAMAMYLAQRPKDFDVILTENLFGDILSDQASTLLGSLGLLPSASLGSQAPYLYEPAHGSAPNLAGRDLANPCAAILSLALMVRHSFGDEAWAQQLEQLVDRALTQGPWTQDLDAARGVSGSRFLASLLALL